MTDVGKARDRLSAAIDILPPKIQFEKQAADGTQSGCSAWMAATPSNRVHPGPRAAPCAFPRRWAAASTASSAQPPRRASTATSPPPRSSAGSGWRRATRQRAPSPAQADQRRDDGYGRALLNFDHVVRAMAIMRDDFGLGLANKRVTLSTAGLVPMIDRLAEERRLAGRLAACAQRRTAHRARPAQQKYPMPSCWRRACAIRRRSRARRSPSNTPCCAA